MDTEQKHIDFFSLEGKIVKHIISRDKGERHFIILNYVSYSKTDIGWYEPVRYDIYFIEENRKVTQIFYWHEINELIKYSKTQYYEIIL